MANIQTGDERMLFFFQAEDGIRDSSVTEFRRVLFRSRPQPISTDQLNILLCLHTQPINLLI